METYLPGSSSTLLESFNRTLEVWKPAWKINHIIHVIRFNRTLEVWKLTSDLLKLLVSVSFNRTLEVWKRRTSLSGQSEALRFNRTLEVWKLLSAATLIISSSVFQSNLRVNALPQMFYLPVSIPFRSALRINLFNTFISILTHFN